MDLVDHFWLTTLNCLLEFLIRDVEFLNYKANDLGGLARSTNRLENLKDRIEVPKMLGYVSFCHDTSCKVLSRDEQYLPKGIHYGCGCQNL